MLQAVTGTITGGLARSSNMSIGGITSMRQFLEARIERDIAALDLMDGDADLEWNGDEFEDADGIYAIPGMTLMPGDCEDDEDDDADEDEDGLS